MIQSSFILRLHLAVILLGLPTFTTTESCDFCNCVAGINPFYNGMDRIGLALLHQRSHIPAGERYGGGSKTVAGNLLKILHGGAHVDEEGVTTGETEQRTTLEISWRHHLWRSFAVTAFLPFIRTQVESTGTMRVQGMGDATVMGHYVIDDLFSERTSGTLLLGGGITLPTGANELKNGEGERIDNRLQPGSGAVGFAGEVLLTVPIGGWTVAADLYGRTHFANSFDDRIGSGLSMSGTLSRDIYRDNPSNFGVVGIAGVRGELAAQDRVAGEIDPASGSQTLWANLGGQVVYRGFKLETSLLLPVAQHRRPGGADEDVRLSAGFRFEFQ